MGTELQRGSVPPLVPVQTLPQRPEVCIMRSLITTYDWYPRTLASSPLLRMPIVFARWQ